MNLELRPSVFARKYFDEMIVCDTMQHNVLIVNDVAADIIEIIMSNGSLTIDKLINTLVNDYEYDVRFDDVADFIEEMAQCNLMLQDGKSHASYKDAIVSLPEDDYDNQVELEFQDRLALDNQLYSALVELTYKCNLNCKHCYAINNDPMPEMSTEQVLDLLDQLYACNVFRLILTGGEIFLRNDIFVILEYAYNKGFLIDIFSNGTLLDEEKVRKVSNYYIRSFQSSIYSHIPEKHDSVTGKKGSFYNTIETLKLFKKHGISINVKSVLMEDTYGDIAGLTSLASTLGASFQSSLSIIPRNNGNRDNLQNRIKDSKAMEQLLSHSLLRINKSSFYRTRNPNEQICGMGKTGISIDPYANVYPCNLLKIKLGNLRENHIKSIWSDSATLSKLRGLAISDLTSKCQKCDKLNYCVFCPGSALAEEGDYLSPYNEACFIAEIKQKIDLQKTQGGEMYERMC